MVERFHRQLKASLSAAADPENWTDHLPLVLLGIHSALRPDLDCSAAELVFGATFRLPGEMISPTPQGAVEDPTNLLHRLRQFMRTHSSVPLRFSASPSYLEKELATCSHVYLRCDRVRRPLEPPYDGPLRVISRGTKNFRIQRGTREEVVRVDRLKAAVPDTPPDEPCGPQPPAPPPRPSIPPSRILPLSPCPQPTTATTPSSTNNTTSTVPSASLRAAFGLAGGYCGSSRILALRLCHAAVLSASHSVSMRCWDARVFEANQRCPHFQGLAARVRRICSPETVEAELQQLQNTLRENGYPERFILWKIRERATKPAVATAEKKDLFLRLPFLGDAASELVRRRLRTALASAFPAANLRVFFANSPLLRLGGKDRLPLQATTMCIYSFTCSCGAGFIGRTTRRLEKRIREHMPAWLGRGEHRSISSSILAHLIDTNHQTDAKEAFKVIYRAPAHYSKGLRRRVLATTEAVAIRLTNPALCCPKTLTQAVCLPWPTPDKDRTPARHTESSHTHSQRLQSNRNPSTSPPSPSNSFSLPSHPNSIVLNTLTP
nr:unnamed protein product [Spirometra erinaceieuropaei]